MAPGMVPTPTMRIAAPGLVGRRSEQRAIEATLLDGSRRLSGSNFMAFSHPGIDAALDAARYGPDCGQAARRQAYATVDRILNEEVPFVLLFSNHALAYRRADFVAPDPTPWGRFDRIETWWLRR